jgi:hypothetical protein
MVIHEPAMYTNFTRLYMSKARKYLKLNKHSTLYCSHDRSLVIDFNCFEKRELIFINNVSDLQKKIRRMNNTRKDQLPKPISN